MTTEDIQEARAFEDRLMAERLAAGLCARCGWPHKGPKDDAACEQQWREKLARQAKWRPDGIVEYPAGGALEDGHS